MGGRRLVEEGLGALDVEEWRSVATMEEDVLVEQHDFERKKATCGLGIRKSTRLKPRVKARVFIYSGVYTRVLAQ